MGVVGYLSATFLGQLLLLSRIDDHMRSGELTIPRWIYWAKTALCLGMMLLGLMLIPVPYLATDVDTAERLIEWNFSLLLVLYFPLTAAAWYCDGFRANFAVRS